MRAVAVGRAAVRSACAVFGAVLLASSTPRLAAQDAAAPPKAVETAAPKSIAPAAKKPESVRKADSAAARKAGKTAEFDRYMAQLWLALSDVKLASEYIDAGLKRSDGYEDAGLSEVLNVTYDAFRRAYGQRAAPPDAARRRIADEVAHAASLVQRWGNLVTHAIALAREQKSWSGEPEELYARATAVLPGIDWSDETWGVLKQAPSFVAALPLEERVRLGLEEHAAGLDLGAEALKADPRTILVVRKDSLGDDMGFEAGDRLIALDGQPLASLWDFKQKIAAQPGARLGVELERKGRTRTRKIKIPESLPEAGGPDR